MTFQVNFSPFFLFFRLFSLHQLCCWIFFAFFFSLACLFADKQALARCFFSPFLFLLNHSDWQVFRNLPFLSSFIDFLSHFLKVFRKFIFKLIFELNFYFFIAHFVANFDRNHTFLVKFLTFCFGSALGSCRLEFWLFFLTFWQFSILKNPSICLKLLFFRLLFLFFFAFSFSHQLCCWVFSPFFFFTKWSFSPFFHFCFAENRFFAIFFKLSVWPVYRKWIFALFSLTFTSFLLVYFR